MTEKCPHGLEAKPWEHGPNTEPILTCTCCGSHFVQIQSGWMSPTESGMRRWEPKVDYEKRTGLCGGCGGHYITETEKREPTQDSTGEVTVDFGDDFTVKAAEFRATGAFRSPDMVVTGYPLTDDELRQIDDQIARTAVDRSDECFTDGPDCPNGHKAAAMDMTTTLDDRRRYRCTTCGVEYLGERQS